MQVDGPAQYSDESDDGEINNGAGCSSKYVKKAVYSDDD